MADNVTLPGTGALVSSEEVTTLNGGAVSAQQVQRVANALRTADGTAIDLPGDAANGLDVDVTRLPALAAGTNNIGDVDVLTLPGVEGAAAHDAAVSGNPVLCGLYAETSEDSAPANRATAEGRAVRAAGSRDGAAYVLPYGPHVWHSAAEYTTAQTDTSLKAAPGAGLSLYLGSVFVSCNGTVTVSLEEGTTTLKWRHYGIANGGAAVQLNPPIKLAANSALSLTTSGAVTCFVAVTGYTAP